MLRPTPSGPKNQYHHGVSTSMPAHSGAVAAVSSPTPYSALYTANHWG
jgi:hypothetical protein